MNETAATTATATDTVSSPRTTGTGAARKLVGLAATVIIVAATVTVAQHHDHSSAPRVTTIAQLAQARADKADRLLDRIDASGTGDPAVLAQIHQVTGDSAAAQQARTRLYQDLRNR
jgi:hypothetical protein